MKKVTIILIFIFVVGVCACGRGNTAEVKIKPYESDLYETVDIGSAINVATQYFENNFSGCTLTEITYAGDEISQEYVDWAYSNNADEVIVLISSFDVDSSGGDGSLNPNSTYRNFNWILVRNNGGKWRHVNHGY